MKEDSVKPPLPCIHLVDPRTQPFIYGQSRGDLPHLHKSGCTFFVTFCLADVTPRKVSARRALENGRLIEGVARNSEPRPTEGSCALGQGEAADIVEAALSHFQGIRYALHAWVVMPNHVHVVVTPAEDNGLPKILHSWKSFTSNQINSLLGRSGRLWQEESFDHVVRSEEHLAKFIEYTENNPVVAGLCSRPDDWRFGSARFR